MRAPLTRPAGCVLATLITVLTTCSTVETRAQAQVETGPWRPGEVRLLVPDLPTPGSTFEVEVRAETGGALLAALTIRTTWPATAAKLIRVEGGLSFGATSPFALNDRQPGQLVISDINAPKKTSSTAPASYNPNMRGRVGLYRLVFRRLTAEPFEISGRVEAFHDPGEGQQRPPMAIGGNVFPRPLVIFRAGGKQEMTRRPAGEVWLEKPQEPCEVGSTFDVLISTQLTATPLACFSLRLRFDPGELYCTAVESGRELPLPYDASLPGQVWVSGDDDAVAPPNELLQAELLRVRFRRLSDGDCEIGGKVVSYHQAADELGPSRPLGALPLPRRVEIDR